RNRREQLELWHALMESGDAEVAVESSRMLSSVNHAAAAVLEILSRATKVGSLDPQFSRGWDESIDRAKGRFESRWGAPDSWKDVILQGPYFHVGNPFATERNESMGGNQDYSSHDLEVLPASAIPATEYKPLYETYRAKSGEQVESTVSYDTAYGWWQAGTGTEGDAVREVRVRDHYRVTWRAMAASTGERTLISAVVPPGAASVHTVFGIGLPSSSPAALIGTA